MRDLGPRRGDSLTLVFMGMGEPLHNVEEVLAARSRVLSDPRGLGIARSRITVSTAGWLAGIERLTDDPFRRVLRLSLNATTDAARARDHAGRRSLVTRGAPRGARALVLRPHEKLLVSSTSSSAA